VLQSYHRLISVDDHIIEHPLVWQDRLPQRYRDMGPKVVEDDDGNEQWVFEGDVVDSSQITSGLAVSAGLDFGERTFETIRYENMRPGAYDPNARLTDMDTDGVWAQLSFPTFARFAGTRFLDAKDKQLALLCVRAYNDFIFDEWCAAAPDRYIPNCILPLWDPTEMIKEVERCAARGGHAISFPDHPHNLGLPSFHTDGWTSVFSAADAAQQTLCMHFGSGRELPATSPDAPSAVISALMGQTLFNALADLVYSPTFHRHPGIQVALAEGGIGWIPYAVMRLDQVWERYRYYGIDGQELEKTVPPSQLVRDHVWGCFIDDPVGIEQRHRIGVDRIMWESDYPHGDGLWPNSRRNAEKTFADIPDDDVLAIVEGNARRCFHFPDS
jgi:predicted TIM-barrel fold metal-dependent hydrolase